MSQATTTLTRAAMQSAQESFAIAENTDQLELIRYRAVMAQELRPASLDIAICKNWLVSRVEDAFDRLRTVRAEGAGLAPDKQTIDHTGTLSTFLTAFATNDTDGASSSFPVDALVQRLVEFEAAEVARATQEAGGDADKLKQALKEVPSGAKFLRPLHKGVLLDAIERYADLLDAEAQWARVAKPAGGAVVTTTRGKKPEFSAVLAGQRPNLDVDQRRELMGHLAAFERGLSAAECLTSYLVGAKDKDGNVVARPLLQHLVEAAQRSAGDLVAAWNLLEAVAMARVLYVWAGDDSETNNNAKDMVPRLMDLGVEADENRYHAIASYHVVANDTDRPGTYVPTPVHSIAELRDRYAVMGHEEVLHEGQGDEKRYPPFVSAPFRIRLTGATVNQAMCTGSEAVCVRLRCDYSAVTNAQCTFSQWFRLEFFGFPIGSSERELHVDAAFNGIYGNEGQAVISANGADPFRVWPWISKDYIDGTEEYLRARQPHYFLRVASRELAWGVRQYVDGLLTTWKTTGKTFTIGEMLRVWPLPPGGTLHVDPPVVPTLLEPMVRVINGAPRRALLKKAIEEQGDKVDELKMMQSLKQRVRQKADDLHSITTLLAATMAYSAPTVYQAADGLRELLDPGPWMREEKQALSAGDLALRVPNGRAFEPAGFNMLQAMVKRYSDETSEDPVNGESPAWQCFRRLKAKGNNLETIDVRVTEVEALVQACMAVLKEAVGHCEEAAAAVGPSFRVERAKRLVSRMRKQAAIEARKAAA